MKIKKILSFAMSLLLVVSFGGCGNGSGNTSKTDSNANAGNSSSGTSTESNNNSGPVELNFMYWGGLVEKDAVQKCVDNYNKLHEGKIHVNAQHVPDDYSNKLASQVAAGKAPDIAYVSTSVAPTYAQEGKLLFVEDLLKEDKSFIDNVLPIAQWKVNGKVAFFSTALESLLITYNKDIFDEHKVAYPPSDASKALNWDDFVKLCKSVTFDSNGNDANSPDFNPENIATYGLSMTTYLNHILMLLNSNGGSILNQDSTNTAFNSPEWIDTMKKVQDLIYVHHVVPTPAKADSLAAEAMLTGQVAMTLDGNWSFLDYNDQKLNVGCAVFPDLGKGPSTMSAPGVTAIFASTKHPEEAWDFYKYSLDAENGATDLYKNGLWQPIYKDYYTNPEKVSFWIDTPAHPQDYKSVVIDNIDKNIVKTPQEYVKNWGDVAAILNPAIDAIFRNEKDPASALNEAQSTIESSKAYQGRYDGN